MTRFAHLVVGPAQHGVTRHAREVAAACGHDVLDAADADAAAALSFAGLDVVHVAFTDRLFGTSAEAALVAFGRVAATVHAAGAALSVTLHDVPAGDTALDHRRRVTYQGVAAAARGVVVNSRCELALVEPYPMPAHSLVAIALPLEPAASTYCPPVGSDAVVLGFVFPDRGYEQVLDSLPPGAGLVALGGTARGHEALPAELADRAARRGRRWQQTGYVPEAELGARLATAAVPVAPNARVTASASINSWLAHGRRPLVPDIAYTRELLGRWPGCVQTYAPDDPAALGRAIHAALDQPRSTWLDPTGRPSWRLDEVAAGYLAHLASCVPPASVVTATGARTVPGNRWDLLTGEPECSPVSVVVPYYDAQSDLDLVLAALSRQDYPHDRLEIVVADDGSPQPPAVQAAGTVRTTVVTREHNGFGAAAARNLGAHAASGDVLVFLDGDTVPERDFVRRLTRLPALTRDGLTVGRRRHADFTGWTPERLGRWLDGQVGGPEVLEEPSWLRDGYASTADLLQADDRSYRYVLSAVLALHRSLFDEIGGFSEQFSSYGGEDWELANRAWQGGAVFAYVPDAVAWHNGPDWGRRGADHRAVKNTETLQLTSLLPDPQLRGPGQWFPYPSVVITADWADPVALLVTARTAFATQLDCGFWLTGHDGGAAVARLGDPRIRAGEPPVEVLHRAATIVELGQPADLTGLPRLCALAAGIGTVRAPALTVTATRARSRSRRHASSAADSADLARLLFGHREVSSPMAFGPVDLDHELARLAQRVRRS